MLKQRDLTHSTDLFFTLSLFCVFAASAFLVTLVGIRVYQSTTNDLEDTYSIRTAFAYVAEKIRQNDNAGRVALGTLEDQPALILEEEADGQTYLTYIYYDNTSLYELNINATSQPSRSLGERILDVRDFSFSTRSDGLLELSASDSRGRRSSILLHPRSQTF